MSTYQTREQWLEAAVTQLIPLFAEAGQELPKVRISVGWPGGKGKKKTTIGQCWSSKSASDKVAQIFISPVLNDIPTILAVLVHELVHAVDDCESGHKRPFITIAKNVGLVAKWTQSNPSDELAARLVTVAEKLGKFPHGSLSMTETVAKPQTTRMLKLTAPDCGYVVRTTQKWIDDGMPRCPHGVEMEQEIK